MSGGAMRSGARREDARLVRGLGNFVDDEQCDRQLHLRIVRSPYAHARILAIDITEAMRLQGVVHVLTGEDVRRATRPFPQMAPEPGSLIQDYCMAVGTARFQGEPVAAVVAVSPEIAEDAAELVRVDYEPLDAVVDAIESLEDRVVLHASSGTNRVFSDVFEWGEVGAAFERADVHITIPRLHFHRFSSVTGQVHGAAAHGIGAALMENFRYDEWGNLLTATFSDYCPITTMNMPALQYDNMESPSPFTFNGAKGMGEGGGGPLHTLSAALQDALYASGVLVADSHFSPSDVHALQQGGGTRESPEAVQWRSPAGAAV